MTQIWRIDRKYQPVQKRNRLFHSVKSCTWTIEGQFERCIESLPSSFPSLFLWTIWPWSPCLVRILSHRWVSPWETSSLKDLCSPSSPDRRRLSPVFVQVGIPMVSTRTTAITSTILWKRILKRVSILVNHGIPSSWSELNEAGWMIQHNAKRPLRFCLWKKRARCMWSGRPVTEFTRSYDSQMLLYDRCSIYILYNTFGIPKIVCLQPHLCFWQDDVHLISRQTQISLSSLSVHKIPSDYQRFLLRYAIQNPQFLLESVCSCMLECRCWNQQEIGPLSSIECLYGGHCVFVSWVGEINKYPWVTEASEISPVSMRGTPEGHLPEEEGDIKEPGPPHQFSGTRSQGAITTISCIIDYCKFLLYFLLFECCSYQISSLLQ